MAWGALMGLGKGLSGTANLLGEKRKLDWEAQQQSVAHDRKVALEMLRDENANKRQKAGFAHTEEMYALGKADTLARDKMLKEDQLARDKMLREQKREDKTWALGQEEASAKRKLGMAEEVKSEERLRKMKEIDDAKFLTPEQKETLKFKVSTEIDVDSEGKPISQEQWLRAYQAGKDEWLELDNKEKKVAYKKAAEAGITEPTEVDEWYGTEYARSAFSGITGGKYKSSPRSDASKKKKKTIDPATIPQVVEAIRAGEVTKKDLNDLSDQSIQAIEQEVEKQSGYQGDFEGVRISTPRGALMGGAPEPKTWGKGMSIDKLWNRIKKDREKQKEYLER